jgi:uncharacterized protein
MDSLTVRYGEWALVAGAAEGIGSAFASLLAKQGMNLVMVDHNLAALASLAGELEHLHGIKTVRIHGDLSQDNAAEECLAATAGLACRLLVYVPAFSPVGRFAEHSQEDIEHFLGLNVKTPLKMVYAFLRLQERGKRSGIILMSSLAGMIGPALAAPYSATKAFSRVLSESLYYEMKDFPVDVLACCAGPTSTPTYLASRPAKGNRMVSVTEPGEVAAYALRKLGKSPVCIPGWKNRFFYFLLTRILPRKAAGRIVSNAMLRMYPKKKGS